RRGICRYMQGYTLRPAASGGGLLAGRRHERQHQLELGADAHGGIHGDLPAVLLDDLVGDRQAEPRALADRLGREERIEDLGQDIGRYALAVVLDFHRDVLVALAVRGERDRALLGLDRLRRVVDQVEQYLVHLRGRAGDERHLPVMLDDVVALQF